MTNARSADQIITRWHLCCATWDGLRRLARSLRLWVPPRDTRQARRMLVDAIAEAIKQSRRAA